MPETPEDRARREIDADLVAAGWLVQSRDELDLAAGRGIAVREFPMKPGFGFADYLHVRRPQGHRRDRSQGRRHLDRGRGTIGQVRRGPARQSPGTPSPAALLQWLDQDLTYTGNQLDRDVVAESQIRTVLEQFRDKVLQEAFPDRTEVPKTLVFAKDDSHADDIVRLAREVFAESNDFCQKITYRTGFTKVQREIVNSDGSRSEVSEWVRTASLSPDEILANFRTQFFPRIAVTVDMISTGTDVKPIECVFFLRNVKSAGFFEQMKGRGVRVISPDRLRAVTPSARGKERFIIVDAVGVCERDKTDSHSLNRQPSKTLAQILEYVAQGGLDPDALCTLAGRLASLQRTFTPTQLAELKELAGGKALGELTHGLLKACDRDARIAAAMSDAGNAQLPAEDAITRAGERLAQDATAPFLKAAFRRRLLELVQQNEQTIDRYTLDEALYAGFDASAVDKAQTKVQDFRAWIAAHKDDLTALQVLYSGSRPLRISLENLRQLREALACPPLHIATSLAIEPADFETGWFGQHGSLGRAHALFGEALAPLVAELNERLVA